MNKDDGHSFSSDDNRYYERRYRDNWNHAVRRASWSKTAHGIAKKRQRAYWAKNKKECNRRRREVYSLTH